jgi:hypothetical protein
MQTATVYLVWTFKIELSGVVHIHAIAIGLRANILGFHNGGGACNDLLDYNATYAGRPQGVLIQKTTRFYYVGFKS